MLRCILALAVLAMSMALGQIAAADSDIIIRFANESTDGQLVEENAPLRTTELQIISERPQPEACFTFNRHLDRSPSVAMETYIQVEPAIEIGATVREKVLCIEGFAHGQEYKVTLLAGLPGVGGKLELAEEHAVKIGAMRPSITFASEGTVLPRLGNEGLPIRTVNLDRVQVEIARINDRNLINRIKSGSDVYGNAYYVGGSEGEPVWSGELLVDNVPNKPVVTALPIDQTIGALKPGLYVATVNAVKGTVLRDDEDDRIPPTSQWFVVSDLGLTSFLADDGLLVQVRSLHTAQPVAGATVALLSRNNKELARTESDADGLARFDPGMVRGKGGNRAAAIYAYGEDGEFSYIGLEGPALDLSDRGVGGRQIPGPLDVYAYAERGIYRPGETANVVFLLRDDHARAANSLPLLVTIHSPDGAETDRKTLTDQGGGSYVLTLPLAMTARSGQWSVTAQASPEGGIIGETSFEVGDFVPPRIEFDLATDAAIAKRNVATPIDVAARYLYGAPAADLNGELAIVIRRAQKPYPSFADYRFGREQDLDTPPIQINPEKMVTDAKGHVSSEFQLKALPDTTQPLEAVVYATLFDVGGRPVKRNITIPIETRPLVIGIKPNFTGEYVDGNETLGFDVAALDPEGHAIPQKGLTWELVKVYVEWELYVDISGRWRWERIERDSPRIAGGTIDVAADQPAKIEQQVGRGRYRLEVFDLATGAATSVGFYAGWWWSGGDRVAAAPDQVQVSLEHASYAPGATVSAFVKPPYDSDVLFTVVDRGVRQSFRKAVPATGADVSFTLPDDTTAGVYLLASAFAPADPERSQLPQRAIGAAWVPVDPSLRKLAIAIDGPDTVEPNRIIDLPVSVMGAVAGEEVFMTLAAVDDGVLQLTDFASPDPLPYYFGKRRLGGDIRDLYGSLIDPQSAQRGTVRSGGDGVAPPQSRQLANAPKRNTEVVSLFSGVVKVGADGHAAIPLKLPDFNGRLRLMAVAWSSSKVGGASRMLTVRAPVVAELSMPLFLAPGDRADLTLSLNNVASPAGNYFATLESDGAVTIGATSNHARPIRLAPNESYRTIRGLTALKAGEGRLHLTLSGPGGFFLERDWHISVRPQNPIETRRMVAALNPWQELKLDWSVADGLFRDTATIDLSVGSVPDFGVAGGTLQRDPYYWTSNEVSRAVPLLYFGDTYRALGLGDQERQAARMEVSIDEILGSQVARGTFAPGWIYWSDQEEEWLTGYVMDFLTRAREQGARVPELSYQRGIRWMTRFVSQDRSSGHDLAVEAYAYYVLARSGNMDAGRLRRFFEARGDKLPTALARAQIGAALARLGDLQTARAAFDSIEQTQDPPLRLVGGDRRGSYYDYATPLRERAAILTMMAESGVVDRAKITALAAALSKDAADIEYLGAQEMAWMLYLSEALSSSAEPLDIALDGKPLPTLSRWQQPYWQRFSVATGAGDILATVTNTSGHPAYLAVSAIGNPVGDLPAVTNGFTISRKIVDRFGNPVDLSAIRQNDLLVVIIEGRRLGESGGQTTVVDMLPSGFEIQNVKFDENNTTDNLAWLGELSTLQQAEYRDDRFVATADISQYYWTYQGQFRMAYMVRAVTPGEFTMAGIYVEDLFRPNAYARGGVAHIRIVPSRP